MIVGFVCMLEGTNLAQNRKSKGTYVDAPVLRPTTRAVIPARYYFRSLHAISNYDRNMGIDQTSREKDRNG